MMISFFYHRVYVCFFNDFGDFIFSFIYYASLSGALVLSGGLVGSIFSRNLATLGAGVFFGGALLALSTFSLKIWREGKSSLPFILGQAGIYFLTP